MHLPGYAMFLARLALSSHTFAKLAWVLPYIPACAQVLDGCRPHVMRVCSPAKPRAADAAAKISGCPTWCFIQTCIHLPPGPCLVYLSLTLRTQSSLSACHISRKQDPVRHTGHWYKAPGPRALGIQAVSRATVKGTSHQMVLADACSSPAPTFFIFVPAYTVDKSLVSFMAVA